MKIGYTLPVFACASAIAAWQHLQHQSTATKVAVNLIKPPQIVNISIEQVAKISHNSALAITRSDPGEHLDITRNTPVWAIVQREARDTEASKIIIQGGAGVGIQIQQQNEPAIYSYAKELITSNLEPLLGADDKVIITIILPEGQKLAVKTSNAAFGVIDGLSLLGTTGIVQPLTAPSQLESFQSQLQEKAQKFNSLVFCIGENGLDLAQTWGINPERLVKTANWLGSMLVMAGIQQVQSILLVGYHGKLIKLAGGIFHTHHHLADGRLEILTAYSAQYDLPHPILQQIFTSPTTEFALQLLRDLDLETKSSWVDRVYGAISEAIDQRSQDYIRKHTDQDVRVGCILFDRQRKVIKKSNSARDLLPNLC
ncbi:MAG: cobalt-precorrin-5B (C(1))-methyltransferase CbiD [Xenococcaceae cyanobacterium MO_234.B1]|nr:cobalt-precorrin-5B (C(1))-methyltransferase CbiD [Xenococcaceae cyanobacterium MO_234.B1]